MRNGLLAALGAAIVLAGCGRLGQVPWRGQDVVLAAEPMSLRPAPVTLTPPRPLTVLGKTTDLCFGLADGESDAGDGDQIRARVGELLHGAQIQTLLHTRDGGRYAWSCGGWMFHPTDPTGHRGRLYACSRWQCNNQQPPLGTEITSVEVSATAEVRVLEIAWRSTAAFDRVPP